MRDSTRFAFGSIILILIAVGFYLITRPPKIHSPIPKEATRPVCYCPGDGRQCRTVQVEEKAPIDYIHTYTTSYEGDCKITPIPELTTIPTEVIDDEKDATPSPAIQPTL